MLNTDSCLEVAERRLLRDLLVDETISKIIEAKFTPLLEAAPNCERRGNAQMKSFTPAQTAFVWRKFAMGNSSCVIMLVFGIPGSNLVRETSWPTQSLTSIIHVGRSD